MGRTSKRKHIMKTRWFLILSLGLALLPFRLKAQIDTSSFEQRYFDFEEQAIQEYNDFVNQAYSEFEQFLAEAWSEFQSFTGEKGAYSTQKPETIPAYSTQSGVIDVNAPAFDSKDASEDVQEQKNAIYNFNQNPADKVTIRFYGTSLVFYVPQNMRWSTNGVKEKYVSKYYETMRKNDTDHVLQKQLDDAVSRMGLNEWGYFVLLRAISERIFTEMNDRVLFSFYMLHSHGFKARVGRGKDSGQLQLLLALDNSKEVYTLTFFRMKDTKFYVVYGNGKKGECVYSYNENADESGLKEIGLDFTRTLHIADCDKTRKLHLGKIDTEIELPYSSTHIRYYDDIPTTVFPIYFKTPVSKEAEAVLAETFASLSKQYNKVQMVDIILNFVQTAFAYKIDEQQFGREKYFYPEEVIAYPFSDCEDRSALFAWLVRRFVGYDVAGVLYADHLATAVYFGNDTQLSGKSVNIDNKRYIVCDPTYSNAPIGTVMPKFANAKYEIVKIN